MPNTYTDNMNDGAVLTDAQLDTALTTLKPSLDNTSNLTSGATTGTFLRASTPGAAATWENPPDPKGPFAVRNYSLNAFASSSALVIQLKNSLGSDPSSTNAVDISFSSNGTTSATHTDLQVTAARSITISASASLGMQSTSGNRIYVYAINNAGTIRLAVGALSNHDRGQAVSTTAMSSSSDVRGALYATAALTVVPRLLGWVEAAHNSGGAWQTPTKVGVTQEPDIAFPFVGASSRALNTSAGIGEVANSASCGSFTTASTSYVDVTNLSINLATSGRPIEIKLIPDGGGSVSGVSADDFGSSGTAQTLLRILRDGSPIAYFRVQTRGSAGTFVQVPPACINYLDRPVAGTYAYKLQASVASASDFAYIDNCTLMAYEI